MTKARASAASWFSRIAVISVVVAAAGGCGDPLEMRGSMDFAILPVGDIRFNIVEIDDPNELIGAARVFARAAFFSGHADAKVPSAERTFGDLSFYYARAGLEAGRTFHTDLLGTRTKWECFLRLWLLGYGQQRYATTVEGVPWTYQGEYTGPRAVGIGIGLTAHVHGRVALTMEYYASALPGPITMETCIGIEFAMNPAVSILVGYTEFSTSEWVDDPVYGIVDMIFKSRCLTTGVVCRF